MDLKIVDHLDNLEHTSEVEHNDVKYVGSTIGFATIDEYGDNGELIKVHHVGVMALLHGGFLAHSSGCSPTLKEDGGTVFNFSGNKVEFRMELVKNFYDLLKSQDKYVIFAVNNMCNIEAYDKGNYIRNKYDWLNTKNSSQ